MTLPATPAWVRVTSVPHIQGASPRLERYLARQRIGRLSSLTSPEGLSRWLSRLPTPDWQVLLPLEEQLGGLVGEEAWPGPPSLRFGPWLVLRLENELSAEGRAYGDPPEQAWPFFRWDGIELCLIGATEDRDRDIAVDHAGLIYLCDREFGELRIMAETGLQMFEKFALVDELRSGLGLLLPIVVASELGPTFAARAGAVRVEEASDAVVAHFLGSGCWIRQQAAVGPNRAETQIVADTTEAMLRLGKLARDYAPEAPMRVPGSLLSGPEQQQALEAAGLVNVMINH